MKHLAVLAGSGLGASTATATVKHLATAAGSGLGAGTATGLVSHLATAAGSGTGASTAAATVKHLATATGSGTGAGSATATPTTPSSFDPVAAVGWAHAYWAEGSEFVALAQTDVANWPDEISTADMLQSNSSFKPVYSATSGPNSKPGVTFDQSNDRVGPVTFGAAISQPDTVVMIGKSTRTNVDDAHFFDTPNVAGRQFALNKTAPAGYYMFAGSNQVVGGTRDTDFHLFVWYFNGTSSRFEKDGVEQTAPGATVGTNALGGLMLNTNFNGDGALGLVVSFVGVYSGDARSDGGWADFENDVETYYGITIS